jgi:hypothetical protein
MSQDSTRRKLAKKDRADRAALTANLRQEIRENLPGKLEDYSEKITIRVTPSEKQKLLARCQGIKVSSYIRAGLFDYPMPRSRQVVPIVTRQMYVELNRIGHNLNQQTRSMNEALKLGVSVPIEHPEAIAECIQSIDGLKRLLLAQESDGIKCQPLSQIGDDAICD